MLSALSNQGPSMSSRAASKCSYALFTLAISSLIADCSGGERKPLNDCERNSFFSIFSFHERQPPLCGVCRNELSLEL